MNEIIILKAKLADAKKRFEQNKIKADNYIIILRDIIDPYTDDFTELDLNRASITLQDFATLQNEAKELKDKIKKLEKELNG